MSVTDEAIERIKEMIISKELRPGDRLPREADLAERLGLSRSSLREAVRALSLVRILDVRRGDGTYVTSLDASLLLDALSFVIELHQDRSMLDLLEARRLLEADAAALAAQRRAPEHLAELRALIDAMTACAGVDEFVENDMAFHQHGRHSGRQQRAVEAAREPLRAHDPRPDLARDHRGRRDRPHDRRAPGDLRRDRAREL